MAPKLTKMEFKEIILDKELSSSTTRHSLTLSDLYPHFGLDASIFPVLISD